jgi:hypothetical protein
LQETTASGEKRTNPFFNCTFRRRHFWKSRKPKVFINFRKVPRCTIRHTFRNVSYLHYSIVASPLSKFWIHLSTESSAVLCIHIEIELRIECGNRKVNSKPIIQFYRSHEEKEVHVNGKNEVQLMANCSSENKNDRFTSWCKYTPMPTLHGLFGFTRSMVHSSCCYCKRQYSSRLHHPRLYISIWDIAKLH